MAASAPTPAPSVSPFLDPGPHTRPNALAIVQLSRDQFQPVYLHDAAGGAVDGYAEGAVLNTRFGSFPHSTMIGMPWGAQVRASVVDTGSRGRKRKRAPGSSGGGDAAATPPDSTPADTTPAETTPAGTPSATAPSTPAPTAAAAAAAVTARRPPPTAASGFVHILPPTPEIWTLSLPHRTQVVYTADYSYILHRLRARPGTRIIEAGSGSGSFTHASARAVYGRSTGSSTAAAAAKQQGHVFSFEFHNERYRTMQAELASHGLAQPGDDGDGDNGAGLVTLTNRDVYEHGFLLDDGTSPEADAVFLDLPAPWRALPHLSRRGPKKDADTESAPESASPDNDDTWTSPLHPSKTAYLCSFSPCIEQVTRTVSMLRRLGWVDIDVVEIANKKIQVYRERPEMVSGRATGGRGSSSVPAPRDVGEAVARLKAIEKRTSEYNRKFWQAREAMEAAAAANGGGLMDVDAYDGNNEEEDEEEDEEEEADEPSLPPTKPWMDGRLTARVENEVKTHTSYLVFAVLPRAWTAADEAAAAARWPCGGEQGVIGAVRRDVRKALKRQQMQQKMRSNKKEKKQ